MLVKQKFFKRKTDIIDPNKGRILKKKIFMCENI